MNTTVEGAATSAPPGAPPRLAAGTVLGGRFTIHELLGRGPLGEQYRATDAKDKQPVTVRLPPPDLLRDSSTRARLEHELAIAAQLDHKNIARTIGFWFEGDQLYLAAEAVDGGSVREMIERKRATGKPFSVKGAYNVVAHVCNALTYAHGALVHGTLTPASVLVNSAGRVKLADFGIGRAMSALEPFRAQVGKGALAAVAPELGRAPAQFDRRADVFSIGAMLFELLSGRPPLRPDEPLSAASPGMPPVLDAVIARCLEPNPDDRFADVQALKQVLHAALEPLVAGASTPAAVSAAPAPTAPSAGTPPPTPPVPPRPQVPVAAAGPVGAVGAPSVRRVSTPKITTTFNVASALAAADESQERWLIQKDKLDFGPFRLAEVKHQLEKGQIKGDHTIVDMENGERRRVREHPLLREYVLQVEGKLEDATRAAADAEEARRHRRNLVALLSVLVVLVAGGAVVFVLVVLPGLKPKEVVKTIVVKEEDPFSGITLKVDPPAPKPKKSGHRSSGSTKGSNGEFSDVTNLGDANEEGGDETLSGEVVQRVMNSNFRVLTGCVLEEKRRSGGLRNVDMDFIIRGSGQVSAVKVNGDTAGPFAQCMFAKMQTVSFPKFNGAKTHASFSLALK